MYNEVLGTVLHLRVQNRDAAGTWERVYDASVASDSDASRAGRTTLLISSLHKMSRSQRLIFFDKSSDITLQHR